MIRVVRGMVIECPFNQNVVQVCSILLNHNCFSDIYVNLIFLISRECKFKDLLFLKRYLLCLAF
jgi:hypothetical protein